jgi:hypothetical protein
LLGCGIGLPESPVIQVNSTAKDVTTDQPLPGPNEFVDSLHHRSWIVQTEQLKSRRRTDLEKLLSIFDQENRTKDHHILNVDEDVFPEAYSSIIRCLRMAFESEDIQIEMEMEDDYLKKLQDKEREIAQKDKALEEQGQALKEKDKVIEEKDRNWGIKEATVWMTDCRDAMHCISTIRHPVSSRIYRVTDHESTQSFYN